MNAPVIELPIMVAALRQAKEAEAQATAHRLAIESQIVALFPKPATGEGTVKSEEFSITFKVTRSVDTDALQAAWPTLGINAQKAFTWKAALDTKQYRAIQDLDPKAFAQLSNFVTSKPAKPTLNLKD